MYQHKSDILEFGIFSPAAFSFGEVLSGYITHCELNKTKPETRVCEMCNLYIECFLCAREHAVDDILTLGLYKNQEAQWRVITYNGNMLMANCSQLPEHLVTRTFVLATSGLYQQNLHTHPPSLFHTKPQLCSWFTHPICRARPFQPEVLGGAVTSSPRLRAQASGWQIQRLNLLSHA